MKTRWTQRRAKNQRLESRAPKALFAGYLSTFAFSCLRSSCLHLLQYAFSLFSTRKRLAVWVVPALLALAGCAHKPLPSTQPFDADGNPIPVKPEEAYAYLDSILQDDTRLVVVFYKSKGELDDAGRARLRKAFPDWWKSVEVVDLKPGQKPFNVLPDMGIRIYAPGTARAAAADDSVPDSPPELQILIYRARGIAIVRTIDPPGGRFARPMYLLKTAEPQTWVTQLFSGKL